MKGNPINDRIETIIVLEIKGLTLKKFPKNRISCIPKKEWIIRPAHKNNMDLKIACITKWKKAKLIISKEIEIIINDNCLKVEKAIIFFKSFSKNALIPDISIVNNEIFIKISQLILNLNKKWNRNSK